MSDLIVDSKYNYKNRYIKDPIFVPRIPNEYELNCPVIVYHNGRKHRIISRELMMRYPIIYDKYYDPVSAQASDSTNTGSISDITVTYCPYTSSSIIYFGFFIMTDKIFNSNIILQNMDNPDKIVVQLTGLILKRSSIRPNPSLKDGNIYSPNTKDMVIRKSEIKIMTLRNAISKYPDSTYLDISQYKKRELLDDSYNCNKEILYPLTNSSSEYHPKTLVYGIEYLSKKDGSKKYAAIISKDASKNKVNSVDVIKNGYDKYFYEMIDNIREKGGIVIPCFWFAWYAMHPETKVHKL